MSDTKTEAELSEPSAPKPEPSANEPRGFLQRVKALWAGAIHWLSGGHTPASRQVAFTIAFVGLAAKMAKADGVAVAVETEAFEKTFYVPPEERANVQRVYDLAAQDVAGYEAYAERIARLLENEPRLLRDVFEALFTIAAADGVLHQAEEAFLRDVAACFGMSEDEYFSVRRIFVNDPAGKYDVLGVSPDVSDGELKARYRQLVRENHPDRLAAEGVPREFLVMADRKLAAINTAYDAIEKERRVRAEKVAEARERREEDR